MSPQLTDTVLGYCNPPGVWLVLLDSNIACFDALRYGTKNNAEGVACMAPGLEPSFVTLVSVCLRIKCNLIPSFHSPVYVGHLRMFSIKSYSRATNYFGNH